MNSKISVIDRFELSNKKKFDFNGRTLHGDFKPAKNRILDFKRRQL